MSGEAGAGRRKLLLWVAFVAVQIAGLALVGLVLLDGPAPAVAHLASLPDATSGGHHQIEQDCAACHTPWMGVDTESCVGCHQEELDRVKDSHPFKKFQDPRNAMLLEGLDALNCVTCHQEHMPERTDAMGVSLPGDLCVHCHDEIAEDSPSHEGMGFETCQDCHNYHDNQAIYEEFFADRLDQPPLNAEMSLLSLAKPAGTAPPHDGGSHATDDIVSGWSASGHAAGGVNCTDCHGEGGDWSDTTTLKTCSDCHDTQTEGFLAGLHGMRIAAGLSPMQPGDALLPMKSDAAHRELTCESCHPAHDYSTAAAAVDACLSCHDDEHSLAYIGTKHHQLLEQGSPQGVSCATCHMPRVEHTVDGQTVVSVDHNQNDYLQPNEKMIRPVCLDCHGLPFSVDALFDAETIRRGVDGIPPHTNTSTDMVREKHERRKRR